MRYAPSIGLFLRSASLRVVFNRNYGEEGISAGTQLLFLLAN